MEAEVKLLKKNGRYRVIKIAEDYYLTDTHSNLICYVFPFLDWFIPKKSLKISLDNANMILRKDESINDNSLLLGSGVAFFLVALLRNVILSLKIINNWWVNLIFILIIVFSVSAIRVKMLMNDKEKLASQFDELESRNNDQIKLRIRPSHLKIIIRAMFYYLFSLVLSGLFLSSLVFYSNIVVLFSASITFFMFMCTNVFFIHEGKYNVFFR